MSRVLQQTHATYPPQTLHNKDIQVKDKLLEQLVAIVGEMHSLCAVLRQNTELAKNNGLLLKRHTARMNALLLERGIETVPEVIEENALLVDQNLILLEQRETDLKSLQRLQEALDALRAESPTVTT